MDIELIINKLTQLIQQKSGTTSTRNSFAASTTTQTIAAANPNRIAIIIHNDSTAQLFVAYGSGATTTDFTVPVGRKSSIFIDDTKDEITVVSDSATGNIRVTEIT